MVNGLLTDRSIGIVKTNHTVPATLQQDLVNVLKLAGAQIRRNIDFSPWPPSSTAQQALAAHFGFAGEEFWFDQVLSAFTSEVVSGQESVVLSSLQAHNLIRINRGWSDTLICSVVPMRIRSIVDRSSHPRQRSKGQGVRCWR